ncbi:MAG: nucleotidyl transferase AbiEii/AbiGii toxin family protein [Candidatus Thorarchaeota archaeon]|nr:nucleotidyl transferase AbiEii/AbiGii toxin family protein [Candidatus Thorarchaeota archaeon]
MDLEMLRYISMKTGLGLSYISKEEKISYLLMQIRSIFGEEMILKGGTALNRVYLSKIDANRFSEDIDIDYFSEEALKDKIDTIKEKMRGLRDFDVSGPWIQHRTLRFDCHYVNELGNRDRVMIEIYLSNPPFLIREDVLVKSPFVDAYPTIFSVYSLEDMLARKIVALYDRTEGKDMYDIFHILRFDLDNTAFQKALALALKFYRVQGEFHQDLIKKLTEIEIRAKYIGDSTNHFIPVRLRPNWKELISTLRTEITELFEM